MAQAKKAPADIRTLCYRCRDDYATAGRVLVKIERVKAKEICDMCGYRMGWRYAVYIQKAR